MPEETPKELTPEQKAEQAAEQRTVAAVTAGLKATIPQIVEAIRPAPAAPAPQTPAPATQLTRPSEEEIADAMVEGNKTRLATLLRQRDAYDAAQRRNEIGNLTAQGSAAIGQAAKMLARQNLKNFKKYEKEIDELVKPYEANGNMATYETYERAHQIVRGRHADEENEAAAEEAIRRSREPAPDLLPEGRAPAKENPKEPESLQEVLKGDWKSEFRAKQRQAGGRSDEEELRKMGYQGGFKQFMEARKAVEQIEEESNGTFNLDKDWACKAHNMKFCRACARSGAEGSFVETNLRTL